MFLNKKHVYPKFLWMLQTSIVHPYMVTSAHHKIFHRYARQSILFIVNFYLTNVIRTTLRQSFSFLATLRDGNRGFNRIVTRSLDKSKQWTFSKLLKEDVSSLHFAPLQILSNFATGVDITNKYFCWLAQWAAEQLKNKKKCIFNEVFKNFMIKWKQDINYNYFRSNLFKFWLMFSSIMFYLKKKNQVRRL